MTFLRPRPAEKTPVVEQCHTAALTLTNDPKNKEKKIATRTPCSRIAGKFCNTYLWPSLKWAAHDCPFVQREITEEQERKLNPLKASKRAAGKSGK
jgi:hypothetical protein